MARQISNQPCNRSAEKAEFTPRPGPVLVKSAEGAPQASNGIAATGQTATHRIREMLHLANLVFAFVESRSGGDEEVLYFLRLGERALSRAGDLLSD